MIDAKKFSEEINVLKNKFSKTEDKNIIESVLTDIHTAIKEKSYNKMQAAEMADKALYMLFENLYNSEPILPISFLDTEIGKAIMLCKYKVPRVYTVKEVAGLLGCTVQQIYIDKHKLIEPIQEDLNLFYEDEVAKYLQKKKVPVENMYK